MSVLLTQECFVVRRLATGRFLLMDRDSYVETSNIEDAERFSTRRDMEMYVSTLPDDYEFEAIPLTVTLLSSGEPFPIAKMP